MNIVLDFCTIYVVLKSYRPIIVKLDNTKAKERRIKLRNLKYVTHEFEVKIYINPDRTIEQLKFFKKLREELKRKQAIAKQNNLNIKYVRKNNKIVEATNHLFDSTPRSSGINRTDCKSDVLNFYKKLNLSASFDKINQFSLNSYINSNLKIFYTNIRSVLNKVDILENYLYMKDIDLFF